MRGSLGRRRGREKPAEEDLEWGKREEKVEEAAEETVVKEKADFGLSGALAKDEKTGNTRNGVVLKFVEPPDAATPSERWRMYVFRQEELLETLHLHRKSSYLAGRDPSVCDIRLLHPSISKQHAVLQYRNKQLDGDGGVAVTPYLMDLGSTNGTFLNGERLEAARYVELLEKDVVKFGESSREFVMLKEDAKAR